MRIEIHLIPDGSTEVPIEARDHKILADKLKTAAPQDASPAPSWNEIERAIPGSHDRVILQIKDAALDDYASAALDGFAAAVAGINGLKEHPDGWVEVEEPGAQG